MPGAEPRPTAEALGVEPDASPVALPADVLHEILQHALEAYPDQECCGLVTGTPQRRYHRVWRCLNAQNRYHSSDPERFPRDASSAFRVPDPDLQRIAREAAARGERVTAIYHSHPDWAACFSAEDRQYAEHPAFPFPNADHLVVSVLGDRDAHGGVRARRVAEVALFRRASPSAPLRGVRVEPAAP